MTGLTRTSSPLRPAALAVHVRVLNPRVKAPATSENPARRRVIPAFASEIRHRTNEVPNRSVASGQARGALTARETTRATLDLEAHLENGRAAPRRQEAPVRRSRSWSPAFTPRLGGRDCAVPPDPTRGPSARALLGPAPLRLPPSNEGPPGQRVSTHRRPA